THREAEPVRRRSAGVAQYGEGILGHQRRAVRRVGLIGTAGAAIVEGDHSKSRAERGDIAPPGPLDGRSPASNEYQRRTGSLRDVVEARAVRGGGDHSRISMMLEMA